MLANDGATVYSIDKDSILLYSHKKMRRTNNSIDIKSCIKRANVVVTAVPSSTFKVPTAWIQPDTTVINVASEPNIDEEELSNVPGVIYVPQIGKVTVALLEYNLMLLHKRYHGN
jgi:methylenetetrahydrofolate dehydrogenase (NAD+)